MQDYKAIIAPTVSGGYIEVKISANSTTQAKKLIETLPYFRSFIKLPLLENIDDNNLTRLSNLVRKAQQKKQSELANINQ